MNRTLCGCGMGCGNQSWDAETRRRWSAAHAARAEGGKRVLPPIQPHYRLARPGCAGGDPIEAAISGRSPGEYSRWLASRWRGSVARVSVPAYDTSGLRSATMLHLGDSQRWGSLIAALPRGQRPATPVGMMLAELLPEQGQLADHWERTTTASAVRQTASERPGLFFRGPCTPQWAAWSLASSGACSARPTLVGPMPQEYQGRIRPDNAAICVDGRGMVRLTGTAPLVSWTWRGRNHVLEHGQGAAAMADYYLWWAHRLHSYHHTQSKSPWDLMLATLAARRGMAWIGRLEHEIEHLDGHQQQVPGQEVRNAA